MLTHKEKLAMIRNLFDKEWQAYGYYEANVLFEEISLLEAEAERLKAEVDQAERQALDYYTDREELRAERDKLKEACQLVLDECQDVLYAARLEEVTKVVKAAVSPITYQQNTGPEWVTGRGEE